MTLIRQTSKCFDERACLRENTWSWAGGAPETCPPSKLRQKQPWGNARGLDALAETLQGGRSIPKNVKPPMKAVWPCGSEFLIPICMLTDTKQRASPGWNLLSNMRSVKVYLLTTYVPGIHVSYFICSSKPPSEVRLIVPILHMGKLSHKRIEPPAQDHTICKLHASPDPDADLLTFWARGNSLLTKASGASHLLS